MTFKPTTKTLIKIIVLMVCLIFLNEYLFRLSPRSVMRWLLGNPLLFIMNVSFLSAITGLVFFVTKRAHWALCVVVSTCIAIAVVNANKFNLRSIPVTFEDFFLVKEIWVLLPQLINVKSLIALMLAMPLFFTMNLLFKKWLGTMTFDELRKPALKMVIVCFAILLVGQVAYTSDLDAWETGLIYSLSNGLRKSQAIDEEVLEAVQDKIISEVSEIEEDPLKPLDEVNDPVFKPNVIVIMSEAFWDVNKLDVTFSKNPIPFFDRLKEESIHGDLFVPIFGGGTANTEFEVLTGMSLKNYPSDWYVVYRDALELPTPSLASIFSELGYETIALHPYYPWYYRRNEVYPLLGFDAFISIEDTIDPPMVGPFVSDAYITDQLIEMIESNDKPIFNFTVTMQNHGPYDDNRFEDDPNRSIEVLEPLSEDVKQMIETYAQGLYYSDAELKRLVTYLRNSKEPTLLLFFGDHLPMLGDDYMVYRETGYLGDQTADVLKDHPLVMSVPYVLWANYPFEPETKPLMNASFITPQILHMAKVPLPAYLGAVELLSNEAPVIQRVGYYDGLGVFHNAESENYQQIRAFYHTLQEMMR